ncbi:GNAT family N-acetyltransferase [Croceivirga thetidis]|uniref:GNAT family N-acetyltransferase n=1 Tax=Croceivirga thetidis TaxID=2721623 RepID=A0ABX1GST7_9FLAO|nr:GNAT family N-acetyltransferase [Croceivirga thetidis]NKI32703.1 GNAT family N-acetyltransferase [Croceivirga thetidis]
MAFSLQPTLENELIILRPLVTNDFEELYQVAKDPLIWEQHQNPDRWKKMVFKEFFKGAIDSKAAFAVIDKSTNVIIGSTRFKLSEKSSSAIEIGWTFLSRNYWGGTYNRSFKTLLITYALQYFDNVLFLVNENNFRSQKAVRKLGGKLAHELDTDLSYLEDERKGALTFILRK